MRAHPCTPKNNISIKELLKELDDQKFEFDWKAFESKLAELSKHVIDLCKKDFVLLAHKHAFPQVDVDFVRYFLELSEDVCAFPVPSKMLKKYNIVNTSCSNDGLVKDQDYHTQRIRKPITGGRIVIQMVYTLSKRAFKKVLLRAKTLIYSQTIILS